jgi:hypothetical protein
MGNDRTGPGVNLNDSHGVWKLSFHRILQFQLLRSLPTGTCAPGAVIGDCPLSGFSIN